MAEKKTVKGMRMVVVDGEVFEVRDEEGALSTNPVKLAIVYRLDKGDDLRQEVGRMNPQELAGKTEPGDSVVSRVVAKWFSVFK